MKFVFIAKHRTIWPVAWLCDAWVERTCRSRPAEPFWSGRPIISGAIRSHAASLKTNRSITPKTASQKKP
jgi:hypothetical protein